jgi:hypothetical protein
LSTAKVELAIGNLKFAGEGSEEWLSSELQKAFDRCVELKGTFIEQKPGTTNGTTSPGVLADILVLGLNSLAAKLKVSNVSELIIAACFKLTQGDKSTCTRQEILEEMKRATNYYKASIVKNYTAYLKTVTTSQRLNEQTSGVYALPAAVRAELEAKLA